MFAYNSQYMDANGILVALRDEYLPWLEQLGYPVIDVVSKSGGGFQATQVSLIRLNFFRQLKKRFMCFKSSKKKLLNYQIAI